MKLLKNSSGFILFLLLCFSGCRKPTSTPKLSDINFLRGDIILCSGKNFGDVDFSLSCKVPVRETFDLALSLLHSFQYGEAEKAFVKIIDLDPDCAMAYWGVAMSIYHAAWYPPSEAELLKASKILEIAESLNKNEKEADYLNAIGSFYQHWDETDHQIRAQNYEQKMEQLYNKYENDTEAAIFYTLALFSTRDRVGKEYLNERKAGVILESLFADQPNHPGIAHYIIHNYDNPVLAPKALQVARRYAEIAPGSSHAQHMPSHIFTRLGLWEESISSNINSLSAVRCYVEESGMDGHYFEEVHAMDYLVYAYLQKGDNQKAIEQYQDLQGIKEFYPMTMAAIAYPLAAIPARIALENKDWSAAAKLELQSSFIVWKDYPWQKAIFHFARTLGLTKTHNFPAAEDEIEILKGLMNDLVLMDDLTLSNQIDQVGIQIKACEAWLNFEQGNQERGLDLMRMAADMESKTSKHPVTPGDVIPADELLGDMFLQMNQSNEALMAYTRDLKDHPNRFNGIYGAAVASARNGNHKQAKMYFGKLLDLTTSVESNRPEIEEAKKYIRVN